MIYLDTSFLAPFYLREATSQQVETILLNIPKDELVIIDWITVEFSSLLARLVHTGELTKEFEGSGNFNLEIVFLGSSKYDRLILLESMLQLL